MPADRSVTVFFIPRPRRPCDEFLRFSTLRESSTITINGTDYTVVGEHNNNNNVIPRRSAAVHSPGPQETQCVYTRKLGIYFSRTPHVRGNGFFLRNIRVAHTTKCQLQRNYVSSQDRYTGMIVHRSLRFAGRDVQLHHNNDDTYYYVELRDFGGTRFSK